MAGIIDLGDVGYMLISIVCERVRCTDAKAVQRGKVKLGNLPPALTKKNKLVEDSIRGCLFGPHGSQISSGGLLQSGNMPNNRNHEGQEIACIIQCFLFVGILVRA